MQSSAEVRLQYVTWRLELVPPGMIGCFEASAPSSLCGMPDFKKLKVWEKAHAVAVETHFLAKEMRAQLYASLQNQMVRAAASVPTNIAEGSRQASRRDFARFLRYALNSNTELEYHIILARDIEAIPRAASATLLASIEEVRKMLCGLLRRVSQKPPRDPERE